ncbi:MAG: copper transporter, partial [Actinomycetota bacterium]|nr:copper transporter [Actinomycetota bacterium]
LAVEALGPPGGDGEDETGFTEALRADDALSARLSTVNNVDTFAGRLAAVLAIRDLAEGRTGHYGRGAQRLIPAPSR